MAKVKFWWSQVLIWVLSVQSLAAAAKITLSSNFAVTNNATEEYSIVGHAKFSYALTGGTKIQNQNETFSLGFVRQEGSSLYSLSIIMMGQNSESGEIGMQVWSANRDNLVRTGATLSVNKNGTLELLDSDGTLAWSPQTQQLASMELLDTGNLVLSDSTNNTLWQSFEHPTNVILPGQNLTLGMKLVSNFSSSNASSGFYSMVMEQNGLALYYDTELYNMWSFWGRNEKPTNPTCSLYQAVLVYNMSGAFLQAVNNTGSNRNNSQVCRPLQLTSWTYDDSAFGLVCTETCRRFMRLESDGNLGSYIYFDNSKRWRAPYDIFSTCQLPNTCGSYGLCSTDSQCTCPNPDGESLFSLANSSTPSQGCTANRGLINCSSSSQTMVKISGINYVSNSFLDALQGIQDLENCTSSCLSNCSCKAAFFINSTLSCYHIADVRTMYQSGNSSDLAFLKVQNESKTNNYLVLGLTIGSTLLALLICVMIWFKIRKRRQRLKAAVAEEEDVLKGLPGLPPRFSFKDLQKLQRGFLENLDQEDLVQYMKEHLKMENQWQ